MKTFNTDYSIDKKVRPILTLPEDEVLNLHNIRKIGREIKGEFILQIYDHHWTDESLNLPYIVHTHRYKNAPLHRNELARVENCRIFKMTKAMYRIKPEEDHIKRFDVETECRALKIWPITFGEVPSSKRMQYGLQTLVSAAIKYGQELPKDKPKVKKWYRVAKMNDRVHLVCDDITEKYAFESHEFNGWLTDRIEYDLEG